MKKTEKVILVDNLAARIRNAKSLLFVDLKGLKVSQQETLREAIRKSGANMTVVKNTLLGRATSKALNDKQQTAKIREQLTGPTALIISENDELSALQALGKFIRQFDMPSLKFGFLGAKVYDTVSLIRLSRLPAKEVLQGQVVGGLMGPLYGLTWTLQGNLQKLVYVLDQRKVQLS